MIKQISICNVVWKALRALADPMTAIRPSKIDSTIVLCLNVDLIFLWIVFLMCTEPSKDCFFVWKQRSNL